MLSKIIGQDEGVRRLRRVVEGKIKSPLLLVGEEGVGRRASVLATVREIIAESRGSDGSAVLQVDRGLHPDVFTIAPLPDKELDVDSIREAIADSNQHPVASPLRFFIIDGADRMTSAAANAILKTLEEPSEFSRFFLLAESYDRVIPTIRSRCGRVDYRTLPESFIFDRVSKFERDPDKALVYTRLGEGSVGRATRYWGTNRIVVRDRSVEVLRQAATSDLPSAFGILDELSKELSMVLRMLTFIVHDLLLLPLAPDRIINVDLRDDLVELYGKCGLGTWVGVWGSLRTAWVRNESAYVNLPLQVKAALVAGFVGG